VAYVYKHIRKDNKQPFYIGVGGLRSFDNYQRANSSHWKGRRSRSKFWFNYADKFGVEVEIVLDNVTAKQALAKEIELIAFYGRQDINTGILVNHTAGGDGGKGFSKTTKKKCGAKNIGRKWTKSQRAKIAAKVKIRPPQSAETRRKMSLASKGKPKSKKHIESIKKSSPFQKGYTPWNKGGKFSEEAKVKMSKSSGKEVINTETGRIFDSAKELAEYLGMNPSTLRDQLTNRRNIKNKTSYKYV